MAVAPQQVLQVVSLRSLHFPRCAGRVRREARVSGVPGEALASRALGDDEWFSLRNTDQIRRFVRKVVKRITDSLFKVVRQRAGELNIYTDELRGDSKAIKTFYGKRLDFIDETIKKKELLLFLMSEKAAGDHLRLLKSI